MNQELQTDRVAVEDGDGNRVFVRRKMGYGIREKVKSGMYRLVVDTNGEKLSMPDVGLGNIALLANNILSWEGPDLARFKTVEPLIDELDPEFGDAVLLKIRELNKARESPNPKSAAAASPDGPTSTGIADSTPTASLDPGASLSL